MPIWITVFCCDGIADISPEVLKAGILGKDPAARAGVDYRTLAENYGVDSASVDEALTNLHVVGTAGAEGCELTGYIVRYLPGDGRPVLVHRWKKRDRVIEEIEEVRSRVACGEAIERRLLETQEVIGIELGASQLKDMGIVIAYEIARYIAARKGGLILNDEEEWREIKDGAFDSPG